MEQSETRVKAGDKPNLLYAFWEIWLYRDLLFTLALRDIRVKYTQTLLGLGWVWITPIITVGVFTFVFGLMIKIPTDGLPYLIFYLVAIIPWYAFISTVNLTIGSIEGNAGLITKVYFPRLIIGGAYALTAIVDFFVGFILIIVAAIAMGFWHWQLLFIMPILLCMQISFALGIGYFLAPLNTKYRDVKHVFPLIIQLFYFATPILYPVSAAPEWIKWWYNCNPLSVVITGYRQALIGVWPDPMILLPAILLSFLFLAGGMIFFIRKERDLIDVL